MKVDEVLCNIRRQPFGGAAMAGHPGRHGWCPSLAVLALITIAASAGASTDLVEDAAAGFTCHGVPIHPKLVELFHGWLSDNAPPVILRVDVSAAMEARNQFRAGDVERRDTTISFARPDGGRFGYRYLGRLTTNACVVATFNHGGGTAVFAEVLLLRFSADPRSGHLVMDVIAREPLGGRDPNRVEIKDGEVRLPAARTREGSWPAMRIRADDSIRRRP
ncbi:MAG: hypothetical protein FJ280_03890 [Planctomycetes bacterium]|nr:hypothetical protein [Planctomycetota bacterium]